MVGEEGLEPPEAEAAWFTATPLCRSDALTVDGERVYALSIMLSDSLLSAWWWTIGTVKI
jgi:hypothetical protein